MSTPHEPRPAPPYGREAAYTAHPGATSAAPSAGADPTDASQPSDRPVRGPVPGHAHAPGATRGHPDAGATGAAHDGPTGPAYAYGGPAGSGYPYAGPAYGTGGYPHAPYRPPLPRNDLAVWSLVLGLVGVLGCLFLTGVPAIVVGNNARRAVAAGQADNDGLAIAGIVLGWVATALGAAVVVVVLLAVLGPLLLLGFAVPFLGSLPAS